MTPSRTTMRSTTTSRSWDLPRIEREVVAEVDLVAVDARPHEAFAPQTLDLGRELAFDAARDRGEQRRARSVPAVEDRVDDLLDGVGAKHSSRLRAMGNADAREEQPQVVGDLGDRADGRARALAEALLLDGDGGAQSLDALDPGFGS